MAKLYIHSSTMNAGQSTVLLRAAHNNRAIDMDTCLVTAPSDNRPGEGRIASRIGIGEPAETFAPQDDLFARIEAQQASRYIACIFIDEARFLSRDQVWQLARRC